MRIVLWPRSLLSLLIVLPQWYSVLVGNLGYTSNALKLHVEAGVFLWPLDTVEIDIAVAHKSD